MLRYVRFGPISGSVGVLLCSVFLIIIASVGFSSVRYNSSAVCLFFPLDSVRFGFSFGLFPFPIPFPSSLKFDSVGFFVCVF